MSRRRQVVVSTALATVLCAVSMVLYPGGTPLDRLLSRVHAPVAAR